MRDNKLHWCVESALCLSAGLIAYNCGNHTIIDEIHAIVGRRRIPLEMKLVCLFSLSAAEEEDHCYYRLLLQGDE